MEHTHSFLAGGGVMGALMRAHDWESTPLGSPDVWPQSLRSAISICLNSPWLGTLLWGPDLLMLYNDGYIPSMLDRHPAALGQPVKKVWDDAWERVAPPFHHAMATGEGFAQECVELPMIRQGKAEVTYWTITASPIRGEDGSVVGLFNQGFEITEQVLAERARQAAERELQATNANLTELVSIRTEEWDLMWNTSPDLMCVIDFGGVLRRVNPAWTRVLGYAENELVNRHVNEFVLAEDHDKTVDAYTDAALGNEPRVINRYRHKDGSIRVLSWAAAPAGSLTYATGRDVTLETAQQAELERAQEQLRQAQKMEAVGQLTGGLAHDFSNLLTAISASLDLIRLRITQGRQQEVDKYISAALDATRRAAALTHRLLAFSRKRPLEPVPVDVNHLAKGMLELVRRTAGPTISVELESDQALWTALVDPSQLENALLNLCINARDAMPGGGRIHIQLKNISGSGTAFEPGLDLTGDYLCLRVSDTGTGMPPEVVAQAFDPFFTTKAAERGTGLGLSMIHSFAKQSGGEVRLNSTLGQGTQVSVYLPRYQGDAIPAGSIEDDDLLSNADTAGETVLVVDDEPAVRMLVTDVLHDMGYSAIEAGDAQAALAILRSEARIDLLITDLGLPGGMTGHQLVETGSQTRPNLPVLFISGYAEETTQASNGIAVLAKPFAVITLATRIRALLGRHPV